MSFVMSFLNHFLTLFLNHFSVIIAPVFEFPSAKNQTKISNKRSISMVSLLPELWQHLNCSRMSTKGLFK
jgi:hypothetical protein